MQLILIVEQKLTPIPENIKVLQDFGYEAVVNSDGEYLASGTSTFVEGEQQAFIDWLKHAGGVWISENPMFGRWEKVFIKEELITYVKH